MTPEQIAALVARITALENFVAEVRDCVPDLFGVDHDLIAVEVIEAFQADALELMPLDKASEYPNTRVVMVDQLRKWASTVKTYTQDYTIDELGDDLFTLGEIRAIIGEVK